MFNDTEGFILAGGLSRRMRSDKSRLKLNNRTFVEIIAETLLSVVDEVSLVGGTPHAKFKTVPDVYPQWGALGGLHSALHACQQRWAIVVACDLPFITTELLQSLTSMREDYDAVVPIQPDGRPQPLCACYRVDTCLTTADALIKSGKRRPLDLLAVVQTRWVQFSELKDLDRSANFFDNINTPEDFESAAKIDATQTKTR